MKLSNFDLHGTNGNVVISYDDEEEEGLYDAKISRAHLTQEFFKFEFSGHDLEEGSYRGSADLKRQGSLYSGKGTIHMIDKSIQYAADVELTVDVKSSPITFTGKWAFQNDGDAFDVEGEFEEMCGVKTIRLID